MNSLLNSMPRPLFVSIALALGLLVIYLIQPPYSACDAQYEVLQKEQTPYLFLDPKKPHIKKINFQKYIEDCKRFNNSGACFPFFEGSQHLLKDVRTVTLGCMETILARTEIKPKLLYTLQFMIELAWGPAAPKSEFEKAGWYDSLNVSIFCDVKSFIQENYKPEWGVFVDKVLSGLPGAQNLPGNWKEGAWKRSLFTVRCQ